MSNPNISIEQRTGITDPNFFATNLYWRTSSQQDRPRRRVLVGLRDTGEANAIKETLRHLPWDVFVLANEAGETEISQSDLGFKTSIAYDPNDLKRRMSHPIKRIESIRGNVAITGMSGVPSIEVAINSTSREKGMKVVALEDFPGAYFHDLRVTLEQVKGGIPDALFVGNDWAKQVNIENNPSFNPDNIYITGFPALDPIARLDKHEIRRIQRGKYGIGEEELVFGWFGQVKGATIEHFQIFLEGLRSLNPDNYKLVIRMHPRDDNPIDSYRDLLGTINEKVVFINRPEEPDVNRVIPMIDLGGNERSTTAQQGISFGIPFVSLAIEEIIQKYNVMSGLRVGVIEDGTSPAVYKAEDMENILFRILYDNDFRGEIFKKMKAWKSDGLAGKRTADKIQELVSEAA